MALLCPCHSDLFGPTNSGNLRSRRAVLACAGGVSTGEFVSLRNAFFTSATLIAVAALSVLAYSQQDTCPCPVWDLQRQGQSLADIAKEAKKNKTAHAKKEI